jgi:hypothetical protein
MCGAAWLVPTSNLKFSARGSAVPELNVERMPLAGSCRMSPPGAEMSTTSPKLEYSALFPARSVAATVMTLSQLAQSKVPASWGAGRVPRFPAATTIVVPRATAASTALCMAASQGPSRPRLMLMTSAGVPLSGTPATVPPEAQVTASMMSEFGVSQRPSTRTGCTFAPGATPEIPSPSSAAATMPATWVPCQEEGFAD